MYPHCAGAAVKTGGGVGIGASQTFAFAPPFGAAKRRRYTAILGRVLDVALVAGSHCARSGRPVVRYTLTYTIQ